MDRSPPLPQTDAALFDTALKLCAGCMSTLAQRCSVSRPTIYSWKARAPDDDLTPFARLTLKDFIATVGIDLKKAKAQKGATGEK